MADTNLKVTLKHTGRIFLSLYLFVAFVGYVYFGPASQTKWLTSNKVYQRYLAPLLDSLLSGSQQLGTRIAELSKSEGEVGYRPPVDLVFRPGREGEALYSGTVVSVGPSSHGIIKLSDASEIELEENSMVLLEASEGADASSVLNLKVIRGNVETHKTANSSVALKLITPKGVVKEVPVGATRIVANVKTIDPRRVDGLKGLVETDAPGAEFIGPADVDFKEVIRAQERDPNFYKYIPAAKSDSLELPVIPAQQQPAGTTTVVLKDAMANPSGSTKGDASTAKLDQPQLNLAVKRDTTKLAPAIVSETRADPNAIFSNAVVVEQEPLKAEQLAEKLFIKEAEKVIAKPSAESSTAKVEFKSTEAPKTLASTGSTTALPKPNVPSVQNSVIDPKKPKKVKKSLKWVAPPDGNDISAAIHASKSGDKEAARRHMANALTKEAYTGTQFIDSTRVAVDSIVDGYVQSGDCEQANNTLDNVNKTYPNDPNVKKWLEKWKTKMETSCRNF